MFSHEIDKNISLKLFEINEAKEMLSLVNKNRSYLKKWLGWVDSTKDINDTEAFIEDSRKQFASNNGFQVGIWFDQKLIGVIGFVDIDWEDKKAEIGYWLDSDYQGKGIITRSCEDLINYAFNSLMLNRIEIYCAEKNTKSQAVPKRLGFTKEGVIREAQCLYGNFVNLEIYGLLSKDWN